MTLHDLPVQERPRERLQEYGPGALSLSELLALILGRGVAGEPVMSTAQKILSQFGSLEGVAEASLEELQQIKGLGLAKACQLKAWAELSSRLHLQLRNEVRDEMGRKGVLMGPVDPAGVAEFVRAKLQSYQKEHYVVVSLDVRNRIIGVDTVSMGTLDAALVHPRETFAVAIKRCAAKVVLAHNHPSGDATPSDDDVAITRRLITAGKILGIQVVDHIIVTKITYFSMQEKGMMGANS